MIRSSSQQEPPKSRRKGPGCHLRPALGGGDADTSLLSSPLVCRSERPGLRAESPRVSQHGEPVLEPRDATGRGKTSRPGAPGATQRGLCRVRLRPH